MLSYHRPFSGREASICFFVAILLFSKCIMFYIYVFNLCNMPIVYIFCLYYIIYIVYLAYIYSMATSIYCSINFMYMTSSVLPSTIFNWQLLTHTCHLSHASPLVPTCYCVLSRIFLAKRYFLFIRCLYLLFLHCSIMSCHSYWGTCCITRHDTA